MKTFYTVRDIEDMYAAGVVDIETHDDVVLTDVAREKAIALGMILKPVEPAIDHRQGPEMPPMAVTTQTLPPSTNNTSASISPSSSPAVAHRLSQENTITSSSDMVSKVKTAVVARLGTHKYDDLIDKIIPQVLSQLKK